MLASLLAAVVLTRTGPVSFVRAVKSADLIVVGRVKRIVLVDGHRFADLDVRRTLKGTPTLAVRFLAEPTWTCDSSDAQTGEEGMFFLSKLPPRPYRIGRDATRRVAIKDAAQEGPVYNLGLAGEGRFIFGGPRTLGLLGNSWYYGPFVMPHAIPPQRDASQKPYYSPERLAYAVERCLTGKLK